MSQQSGNWKLKGQDQNNSNSEGGQYRRNNYRGSPKNRYFRSSNSEYMNRYRNHRDRDDYDDYENEDYKTNSTVESIQKKTGYHFSNVEIENLLKTHNESTTIQILNDKYKNSYSRIVSGTNLNNLEEEQSPKKSKKTNGSKKREEKTKGQTEMKGNNQSQQTGNTKEKTKKQTQQTSKTQTENTQQNNQTSKTQTENTQQTEVTKESGHTKETGHTQNQQTGHKETGHKETGHKETGHKETGHKETQREEDVSIDDLKLFERTLSEKQLQLNKQTEILNRLLEEYSTIKDTKSRKIDELKKDKELLEIKKQKYLEEITNTNKLLKDIEEQIITSEKDLVQQLSALQKKAEPLNQTLFTQKSRKI